MVYYVQITLDIFVVKKTVKARAHHGASSLNLTIPAEMVREFKISEGDIFVVEVENVVGIKLIYKRVYSSA